MMTDKPLYIFDLDGTLALIEHRVHMLNDKANSQRWKQFYEACNKDKPNKPVIDTMERLLRIGCEIWIFSGRSDAVRNKTIAWLADNSSFMTWDADSALTMRAEGDYTADDELKESWLNSMLIDDRKRLVAVFDDRYRVVNMWRKNGVTCFQVASGEF